MSDFLNTYQRAIFDSQNSGQIKILNTLEIRKYLQGWFYNVGSEGDIEMDVLRAFSDKHSLVDWFGTDNIQYDPDFAVDVAEGIVNE
jgi:hypothetical protein